MRTRIDVRTWIGLVMLPLAACSDGRTAAPAPPAPAASAATPPAALPAGHPPVGTPAAGGVAGTLTLAASAATAAREARAVFVIARAGKDRQIVAVRKIDAPVFPLAFALSPQDAMSHGTPFAGPLEITARLSRSGDAAPAAGDVEGVALSVAADAKDVTIELGTVRR
jgi:cytochrome c-type biogenesis protein CcmH